MYPGTFDPITLGHLDIIERAAKLADVLVVAIMENPRKVCEFTAKERKELIEKACRHIPNVEVYIGKGLSIDFAKEKKCQILVRGIRAVADYENELAFATSNRHICPEIEVVLLVAQAKYSFLSSSIAKEVARHRGDIRGFIPENILEDVSHRLRGKMSSK